MNLKLVRRPVAPAPALNEDQRQVTKFRGRALVHGAAGTGKTTTLIQSFLDRVNTGVDPRRILVLTYGRQTANDLRDRIALAAGSTTSEPIVRTFHSLAFHILNQSVGADEIPFELLSGAEHDALLFSGLTSLGPSLWSPELQAASQTRTFVREVRDVLMRATENGLTPDSLASFKNEEKYWGDVATFWKTLETDEKRINSSEIIVRAIEVLKKKNELSGSFDAILVDEFQESEPMQRQLLELIAPNDLILFFDADSTVGEFRGAHPEGVKNFADGFTEFTLSQNYRDQKITCAKLRSISEQADYIAQTLRRCHVEDGIAWKEMAIVIRSPGQLVQALQRSFSINHIPLTVDTQALALADNPAVRPLLDLANLALTQSLLVPQNWNQIEGLLTSDLVGADRLELRQIRMALAKERDDHQEDSRTTTEIMIDIIKEPTHTSLVDVKSLERLRDLIMAAQKAARGNDITDVLFAIWDNARSADGKKVSTAWRERALKGGARGASADRDLDAVITLFDTAKRYTDRNPTKRPLDFINHITGQRLASDAISFEAQREDSVKFLTVHSAKGLEWDLVVIPGLQEGQWPNLKERGSLLGSERITERRTSQSTAMAEIRSAIAARLAKDEHRLFTNAMHRSKKKVILCAIEMEDTFPSRYFLDQSDDLLIEDFKPERGLNLHSLVAQLRRDLLESDKRDFAAALLNQLKVGGVSSADPDTWLGAQSLSSDAPIVPDGKDIFVSPSSLQSFEDCALKWFLEKSGAQDGDTSAQLLGVAVHKLAALVMEDPTMDAEKAEARLRESWKIVDQSVGWFKSAELDRVSEMLVAFFDWHGKNPNDLKKAEENFEVKIANRVVLHGQVDRLEVDADGKIFIVDIKTGSAITKPDAEKNRQMNAYQVAANEGGFIEQTGSSESSGSSLLYVSDNPAKERTQSPVNHDEIKASIVDTGLKMGGNQFPATINKNCRMCKVTHLCPLQAKGRTVID